MVLDIAYLPSYYRPTHTLRMRAFKQFPLGPSLGVSFYFKQKSMSTLDLEALGPLGSSQSKYNVTVCVIIAQRPTIYAACHAFIMLK